MTAVPTDQTAEKGRRIVPVLTHLGINVWDLALMERFYTDVIGLVVTDRGVSPTYGFALVFLSADPAEHHQLALAEARDPHSRKSTVNQVSFLVASLDELRVMYRRVREASVRNLKPINHGLAWSLYFDDPEGNLVEIYTHSPWYIDQPHGELFDPESPTDQIWSETLAMCRLDRGFRPIEEFQETVRAKLEDQR